MGVRVWWDTDRRGGVYLRRSTSEFYHIRSGWAPGLAAAANQPGKASAPRALRDRHLFLGAHGSKGGDGNLEHAVVGFARG